MGIAPSIPTDSEPRLRVIGAGYIRTGTLSFSKACEVLLQGPAWHGGAQILHRDDSYVKILAECYQQRHNKPVLLKLLRQATAGFVACSDLPMAHFAPELLEIYPDAVVICTTRDPERWWKSCEPVASNAQTWFLDFLLWPCPGWRWWTTLILGVRETDGEHFEEPCLPSDIAPGPEHMTKHNEWLKRVIPKEKLHFVEVKDRWEPLCKALGLPVPKEPFPNMNDADSADRVFKGVIGRAALIWMGLLTSTGLTAGAAWWFWGR